MASLSRLRPAAAMSDRPARVVYARPPSKSPPPRRAPTARLPPASPAAAEPPTVALTSQAAIQAFLDLIRAWKLPPSRGWRMLTGVGWQAGSLTSDQVARVQHLVAINAGLRAMKLDPGEWMVMPNPAPVLAGSARVDYLTRTGTRGCEALARQIDRWRGL